MKKSKNTPHEIFHIGDYQFVAKMTFTEVAKLVLAGKILSFLDATDADMPNAYRERWFGMGLYSPFNNATLIIQEYGNPFYNYMGVIENEMDNESIDYTTENEVQWVADTIKDYMDHQGDIGTSDHIYVEVIVLGEVAEAVRNGNHLTADFKVARGG